MIMFNFYTDSGFKQTHFKVPEKNAQKVWTIIELVQAEI